MTVPVEVNVATEPDAASTNPDARVMEEVLVLRAAQARRDARRHSNDGDVDAALHLLTETARELRRRSSEAADPQRITEEADDLAASSEGLQDAAAQLYETKAMWARERELSRGRPSHVRADDPSRPPRSGPSRRPRRS